MLMRLMSLGSGMLVSASLVVSCGSAEFKNSHEKERSSAKKGEYATYEDCFTLNGNVGNENFFNNGKNPSQSLLTERGSKKGDILSTMNVEHNDY